MVGQVPAHDCGWSQHVQRYCKGFINISGDLSTFAEGSNMDSDRSLQETVFDKMVRLMVKVSQGEYGKFDAKAWKVLKPVSGYQNKMAQDVVNNLYSVLII